MLLSDDSSVNVESVAGITGALMGMLISISIGFIPLWQPLIGLSIAGLAVWQYRGHLSRIRTAKIAATCILAFFLTGFLATWGLQRRAIFTPSPNDIGKTFLVEATVRNAWDTDFGSAFRLENIRTLSPDWSVVRLPNLTLYTPELREKPRFGSRVRTWLRLRQRDASRPIPWPIREATNRIRPPFFATVKDERLITFSTGSPDAATPLNRGCRELLALFIRGQPSPLWRERFAPFGVGHLLAISGLHCAIVFALLQCLLWPVSRPLPRLILIITGLLAFATWVGWTPSVTRASLTLSIWLALTVLCRPRQILRLWSCLLLVSLLCAPELLVSRGFWYSFAASLGLICARQQNVRSPLVHPWLKPVRFALPILAAQMFVMPVNLMFDGYSPTGDVIWNLFGIMFLMILLALLFFCVVASLLPAIAPAVNFAESQYAESLTFLAKLTPSPMIERLPFSPIYVFLVLTAMFLVLRCGRREVRWYMALLVLVGSLLANRPPRQEQLMMVDVGQGQCVIYVTADGDAMIYDAGGKLPPGLTFDRLLRLLGVRKVAVLIVSHHDWDHYGLIPETESPVFVPAPQLPTIRGDPFFQGRMPRPLQAGDSFQINNVNVRVLWPKQDRRPKNDNEGSLVMHWQHRDWSLLLMGDAGTATEPHIDLSGVPSGSVLQVGHHGSRTATSANFIERLQPARALISCGRNNRFNHPHPSVISTLESAGVPTQSTAQSGTIQIEPHDLGRKTKGTKNLP